MVSDSELRVIAKEAAEQAAAKAIREVFKLLGVDIDEQEDINDLRADLIYARELRKMSRSMLGKVLVVMATGATLWLLTIFGAGIKTKLGL